MLINISSLNMVVLPVFYFYFSPFGDVRYERQTMTIAKIILKLNSGLHNLVTILLFLLLFMGCPRMVVANILYNTRPLLHCTNEQWVWEKKGAC